MAKYRVEPRTGCWVWMAAKRAGYGAVWVEGRYLAAHRLSYEWCVGPIPEGKQLDHRCRNRACINPAHLEPVSCEENLKRSPYTQATKNIAKTHCKWGHPLEGDNLQIYKGKRRCRACYRVDGPYGKRRRVRDGR